MAVTNAIAFHVSSITLFGRTYFSVHPAAVFAGAILLFAIYLYFSGGFPVSRK